MTSAVLRLAIVVLVFSLLLSTLARAQAAPAGEAALTLERARQLAIERSPVLRAKRAQLEQAEGRLETAKTFPTNPELDFEVGSREGPAGDSTDREVRLEQEIEIGGQRSARVAQAEAERDAIRSELLREEHLLAARVRLAFAEALHARDVLRIEQANAELARSLASGARKRFDEGAATQLALNLVLGQTGRAERALLVSEGAYRAARSALAEVVAADPAEPPEIAGELTVERIALSPLSDLLDRAVANRGDLEAFRKLADAARARITLAKRERVPNMVFGLGAREEAEADIRAVSLGFRIPLFQRNQGAIAEATGALHEAEAARDSGELEVRRDVAAAYHRYRAAAEAAARFQQDVLGTLEDNLHLLERSFEVGKISWTDVLVFRGELVDIEREAVEALTDARIAGIELDLAAGPAAPPAPVE
jgi:cobalt-zinc-cadmium efflux system outer membrane protein